MLANIRFAVRLPISKNVKIRIHKTVALPVVCTDVKLSSLTVREEHTLRAFENRVVRKVLRPNQEKVKGGGRSLHNGELHDPYPTSNIRIIKGG
jgi:hypothetical protein